MGLDVPSRADVLKAVFRPGSTSGGACTRPLARPAAGYAQLPSGRRGRRWGDGELEELGKVREPCGLRELGGHEGPIRHTEAADDSNQPPDGSQRPFCACLGGCRSFDLKPPYGGRASAFLCQEAWLNLSRWKFLLAL